MDTSVADRRAETTDETNLWYGRLKRMEPKEQEESQKPYCPVCGFEMKETRGCCPWCKNCGYKSVCGDPTT